MRYLKTMVGSCCGALLAMCLALLHCGVAGYCSLDKPGYTARVKYIREGFEKRVSRGGYLYLVIITFHLSCM